MCGEAALERREVGVGVPSVALLPVGSGGAGRSHEVEVLAEPWGEVECVRDEPPRLVLVRVRGIRTEARRTDAGRASGTVGVDRAGGWKDRSKGGDGGGAVRAGERMGVAGGQMRRWVWFCSRSGGESPGVAHGCKGPRWPRRDEGEISRFGRREMRDRVHQPQARVTHAPELPKVAALDEGRVHGRALAGFHPLLFPKEMTRAEVPRWQRGQVVHIWHRRARRRRIKEVVGSRHQITPALIPSWRWVVIRHPRQRG